MDQVATRSEGEEETGGGDVSQRLATSSVTKREDPDEALRGAIKAALDAGDFGRVRALIDVLDPPKAAIVSLAQRRGP